MNAIALDTLRPPAADPQVVRRVLAWMREQPAEGRARAISALARAYLASPLPESHRADALLAMTGALDDACPQVRRALAEALAGAADAPKHIVMALAADRADVARAVLAHSPLLDDATLTEAAALGEASLKIVIAQRHGISGRALWTLANSGERAAVVALVGNGSAALDARALRRVYERFADDALVRERLASRGGLPPSLRVDLALASVAAATEFGMTREWLEPGRAERLGRDAREQAIVRIAKACAPDELLELVTHVRERGLLNVALLMRSLLSGDLSLFETALEAMSGAHPRRVAGFVADWRGRGFAALYHKAGLPEAFLPAFRAALGALAKGGASEAAGVCKALALLAIGECESHRDAALAPVVALMWRLAGEGAREEARGFAGQSAPPEETRAKIAVKIPDAAKILDVPNAVVDFAPRPELDIAPRLELEFAAMLESALRPEVLCFSLESEAPEGDAPRLDFAAGAFEPGEDLAPNLPPALAFEGVNENFAPPVEVDLDLARPVFVAA